MRYRSELIGAISTAALMVVQPAVAATITFTYDALGRLATVTYPNGTVVTYSYDSVGNRTARAVTP